MSTRGGSKDGQTVEKPPRVTRTSPRARTTTLEAKTTRAAIYASPNGAVSAEEQTYQCIALALARGFNDLHAVVDSQGGDDIDRLLLKTLREEVIYGARGALIAYSPSVLSNDPHLVRTVRGECEKANAELLFVRE